MDVGIFQGTTACTRDAELLQGAALSRALKRAESLASTIAPSGRDILAFLRRPDILDRMAAAAENGRPSLEAVTEELRSLFAPTLEISANRKAIGGLIASVMEHDLGYEPARSAIRVNDPLFRRATAFRKSSSPVAQLAEASAPRDAASLAGRIVAGLTRSECEGLMKAVAKKFPDLFK